MHISLRTEQCANKLNNYHNRKRVILTLGRLSYQQVNTINKYIFLLSILKLNELTRQAIFDLYEHLIKISNNLYRYYAW